MHILHKPLPAQNIMFEVISHTSNVSFRREETWDRVNEECVHGGRHFKRSNTHFCIFFGSTLLFGEFSM